MGCTRMVTDNPLCLPGGATSLAPDWTLGRTCRKPAPIWKMVRCILAAVAGRVGVEPTEACAPPVFKTGALGH